MTQWRLINCTGCGQLSFRILTWSHNTDNKTCGAHFFVIRIHYLLFRIHGHSIATKVYSYKHTCIPPHRCTYINVHLVASICTYINKGYVHIQCIIWKLSLRKVCEKGESCVPYIIAIQMGPGIPFFESTLHPPSLNPRLVNQVTK